MKSIKPRKQRKKLYNAPLHKKRKWIAAHLSENLLLKYDKRSVPVVTGDTVKVMRGSFKGHEDKVASVHVKNQTVEIEGITTVKADGTKIARSLNASNLLITKLDLTDRWRRQKLERGLSETTKKEIEIEAEEQIKEEKKLEELRKKEEKQKVDEEETLEKKQTDEIEEPKPSVKEVEKKEEINQKKQVKPKTDKKSTKKESTKKTTSKEKENKEEGKK
jgi:large subunit ribosomal protein L24